MSIITKAGDAGRTALMYNRRVSKCHPRVEAFGAVDELNSALGLARATAENDSVRRSLLSVQKDLVILMGELATSVEDLPRYVKAGHSRVAPKLTRKLEKLARELEVGGTACRGWAVPGASVHAAALDLARAICRRAERRVCALQEKGELRNPQIIVYLNRLSDVLWLLARQRETKQAPR